jgi:hypothetical protein
MITYLLSGILAVLTTVGFMRSIRRENGARATLAEWFLSGEVGVLVGVFGAALLRSR